MVTELGQKTFKYECEKCNLKTNNKKDFVKHQNTAKHLKPPSGDINGDGGDKTVAALQCNNCSKIYSSRNGLWKHKKKCNYEEPHAEKNVAPPDIAFFTNLVLEVVKNNSELQKQNQDFQKQMLEMYKTTSTSITNNNNNSHSYNKTFNLQFFLNEQCKDAMNIMDFVDSMTLEFSDLEDVGKLGYVEGISNIIIRKLNELDVYKRPIHCSDGKREIMYVKDENVWEKENSTYDRLRKAIKYITKKNGDMMIPWSKEHPACMNTSHPLNDVYIQIMGQAMGGKESFVDSENKIMKKIAKAVLIDK